MLNPQPVQRNKVIPRKTPKIGTPGFNVVKHFDKDTNQRSLLFRIFFPDIDSCMQPRHRFMSAYEQKVEPRDERYQYV